MEVLKLGTYTVVMEWCSEAEGSTDITDGLSISTPRQAAHVATTFSLARTVEGKAKGRTLWMPIEAANHHIKHVQCVTPGSTVRLQMSHCSSTCTSSTVGGKGAGRYVHSRVDRATVVKALGEGGEGGVGVTYW